MTKGPLKNVSASVRARLLAHSKARQEDFQLSLARYAGERLLYRLSQTPHAAHFVLKGATLFTLWRGNPHRATRDLDLLGFGAPTPEAFRSVLMDVLRVPVEDDGLAFDVTSLRVGLIREEQAYGGVRATLTALLEAAKIRLQIDVGFGDAVTPGAELAELPTLLDMPAPILRVYPREAVVAEKLDAMCQLGLANSRMKDFYDLVVLSRMFDFDGALLLRAVRATFANRETELPKSLPVALTPTFYDDPSKRRQWQAFLKKADGEQIGDLPAIAALIREFVEPVLRAAAADNRLGTWTANKGWSRAE